jgi:hypothetical protein
MQFIVIGLFNAYTTSWHDGGGDKHTKRLYVHDTR